MIKLKPLLLILATIVIISCNKKSKKGTVTENFTISENLIQACIDSTLSLDPGLNSETYLLDVKSINNISKLELGRFLILNKNFKLINLDSLRKTDSTWIKYKFFNQAVIRFESIIIKPGGVIEIETSKIRAADGAIGVKMVFISKGRHFKCLKSGISWIS